MSQILLLTRDRDGSQTVATALQCISGRGMSVHHEVTLRAGFSTLETRSVQVIVVDPDLCAGRLNSTLIALRSRSDAPIILWGQPTERGSGRMLIRLPRRVHAIISRHDPVGLRRTIEALARIM